MRHNPYDQPEVFGLEIVDQIDFSDGSYRFDFFTVWRNKETNAFYWARDSGCSCPSPYEDMKVEDLILIPTMAALHADFDGETRDASQDERVAMEKVAMIEKLYSLGLR